ncbi:magnesium transporter CorA family protein [Blastochloris viridis]|nr:magnesium transporter CorA family protein [Blastochloris viridis]BAS00437.1 magnesium and cobalt transport protein CorA [Blastochloris viridis]
MTDPESRSAADQGFETLAPDTHTSASDATQSYLQDDDPASSAQELLRGQDALRSQDFMLAQVAESSDAQVQSEAAPDGAGPAAGRPEPGGRRRQITLPELPSNGVWFDLISPTPAEAKAVEALLGFEVPTREEMQEIEPSSRLYEESGARYMTATLLCQSETAQPRLSPVTFILRSGKLITVRYDEPRPFAILGAKLARNCPATVTGLHVFMDLLEAIVDRSADTLERLSAEVDNTSTRVFATTRSGTGKVDFKHILRGVGRRGDLCSKSRESLVSIGRLLLYMQNEGDTLKLTKDMRAQIKSMSRDVTSLTDHASYLGDKVQFLLDATLGLVTIDQNDVIKIFAVLSVVLMPPTLVASMYGMNFKFMPELEWHFGYPMAVVLMLLAAALPYLFFRWKKWL